MQRSNLDRLTSEATFEATSEASEATSDAPKDGKDGGNTNQETPAERVLAPSHDGDHDGAGDDYDAPDVRGFHVQQPFAYDRLVQSGGGFEQVKVVLTESAAHGNPHRPQCRGSEGAGRTAHQGEAGEPLRVRRLFSSLGVCLCSACWTCYCEMQGDKEVMLAAINQSIHALHFACPHPPQC